MQVIVTMYRVLFTGFFAFLLMFQSLDRFGMIAFYELNKAYITKMFCVNKSRPSLKCEGKCFLRKQLNEKDQTEKQYPGKVLDVKEIHLIPIDNPSGQTLVTFVKKIVPPFLNTLFSRNYIHEVFHPPK